MSDVLLQVVGALLFGAAMVWDKYNLRRYSFTPPTYTAMMFVCLSVFSGVVALFTFDVQFEQVGLYQWVLFVAVVLLAFLWNKLYYYFQKREELQDFEVMNLVVPAATALLAGIIYIEERNTVTFMAVAVSLLTLFAVRLDVHHTRFNAYSRLVVVMIFAMAGEAVLRKTLLYIVDPATLYFFRTVVVTALLLLFYRSEALPRRFDQWRAVVGPAILGGSGMIIMFYGYTHIGLVMTTLVFALSPLIVYFLDSLILRERIQSKNIIAAVVIVVAIVLAASHG